MRLRGRCAHQVCQKVRAERPRNLSVAVLRAQARAVTWRVLGQRRVATAERRGGRSERWVYRVGVAYRDPHVELVQLREAADLVLRIRIALGRSGGLHHASHAHVVEVPVPQATRTLRMTSYTSHDRIPRIGMILIGQRWNISCTNSARLEVIASVPLYRDLRRLSNSAHPSSTKRPYDNPHSHPSRYQRQLPLTRMPRS